MDWSKFLSPAIWILGMLVGLLNTWMMQSIRVAISELKLEIAKTRGEDQLAAEKTRGSDEEKHREWVEKNFVRANR